MVVAVVAVRASNRDPTLQSGVARALADRSDAVAASLARGDRCVADRAAGQLQAASIVAVRRKLVSPQVAPELLARTRLLARSISCPPPARHLQAPPPPEATSTPDRRVGPAQSGDLNQGENGDHGEHGHDGKRGHGRGRGNSQ